MSLQLCNVNCNCNSKYKYFQIYIISTLSTRKHTQTQTKTFMSGFFLNECSSLSDIPGNLRRKVRRALDNFAEQFGFEIPTYHTIAAVRKIVCFKAKKRKLFFGSYQIYHWQFQLMGNNEIINKWKTIHIFSFNFKLYVPIDS